MNFYLIPAFGMLAFIAGGCATSIDMGTCSCVCGGSGSVISSSEPATYYDRIRGPKGALGNPGKPGPQGPPGSIGKLGPRGEPGRSFGGSGSRATPAESCFDLRVGGKTTSGIYTIQPTEFSAPIEVYCDLKSAGGGWTLVASIHENNIYGKCTAGDKWSSEQGKTSENYRGTGSWENYEIFGNPESATSADYKSPAYFSLQGSNVMIWHVPNNVDIQEAYTEADLKYYTDTGFLAEYGGTLQSLFSKHYPLTIASRPGATMEGVTSLISALNQSASTIRAFIPDFYQYVYDFDGPVQNYIKDGGQDMFDTGNKLYYQIGDAPPTLVTYNKNYRNRTQGVDLLAATSHPFNALMWVGNPAGVTQSFRLKVTSGTGADGDGSSRTMSGAMTLGNFSLSYHAYNVYSASDPSICEVFYYVSNPVVWSSVPPTSFEKSPWTSGTDTLSHGVVASGSPQSFLMGYTLLSRASDSEVAEYDIRRILNKTLSVISNFGKIDEFNCSRIGESLVQPIVYLSGNNDKVLNKIPPLAKAQVTPGFLQFRAYSPRGIPNAICPAVKSEACKPESVCLGGINTMSIDSSSCGDFAGWGGSAADTPTKTQPSGAARALDDINSSILIFTRKQA